VHRFSSFSPHSGKEQYHADDEHRGSTDPADIVNGESEKKTVMAPINAAADIVWQ